MTMRKAALIGWLAVFGFLTPLMTAAPAFAEPAKAGAAAPADTDVTDFNDWRFACASAAKGAPKECRIFQKVVWNKDKGRVDSMMAVVFPLEARPPEKDKSGKLIERPVALMRLVLPLGADLRPGLAMVVGKGGKQINIPYEVCMAGGCVANAGIGVEFLAKIKAADAILVAYKEPGQKPTTLKISLKGFPQAFDALAKTAHSRGKSYERDTNH